MRSRSRSWGGRFCCGREAVPAEWSSSTTRFSAAVELFEWLSLFFVFLSIYSIGHQWPILIGHGWPIREDRETLARTNQIGDGRLHETSSPARHDPRRNEFVHRPPYRPFGSAHVLRQSDAAGVAKSLFSGVTAQDAIEQLRREREIRMEEDDALRDGFTQIPNAIVRHPGIPPGAKVAYAVLLSYAWKDDRCFPGQDRMSTDMAVSKPSVIAYLKQLQQAGLITITRRGQGKSNIYTLPALRSKESLLQEVKKTAPLEVKNFDSTNTQRKDPKKKKQISNFELPTPMKRVQPVTPEFKTTHPDLWQAGCSGVAEFIKTVGRGLWTDEAMNVSQWQAHSLAAPKRGER